VTPQQVIINQKVHIQLELTNDGDLPGNYSMLVKIDDEPKIEEYIYVDGNTIKPVIYSVTVNTVGTYVVSVGDRQATFTAIEAQ
jgi:hypothetical protein